MKCAAIIIGFLSIGFVFTTPGVQKLDHDRLQGVIDGLINSTINKIIQNLSDPMLISSKSFNISSTALSGDGNISNFMLTGLKDVIATRIDVAILALTMNATIKIPTILLNTKYYADVTLMDLIPLYGSGHIGITLEDIEVTVSGKLSLSPMTIKNVSLALCMGDAFFDFHGLLNNEDFSSLLNQILNDNLSDFINENQAAISNIIDPIINNILSPSSNSTNSTLKSFLNEEDLYELEDTLRLYDLEQVD